LEDLLKAQSTPTGPGQGLWMRIRQLSGAFGIETEELNNQAVADSLMKKLALAAKSEINDPQMSNSDREFYERMAPEITKTKSSNLKLLGYIRKVHTRKILNADMAREMMANDMSAGEIELKIREYNKANPIFGAKKRTATEWDDFNVAGETPARIVRDTDTGNYFAIMRDGRKVAVEGPK
jgi:hypothetical protein